MAAPDSDPHNTIPSANATFLADLQNFLQEEDANRYDDMFNDFVFSGGIHATAAGLTSASFSTVAYISGYRVNQGAMTITYADASTTWVIANISASGNIAGFTRVGSTHLLTEVNANQPALPADCIYLMEVTTAAGAISAVTDMRFTDLGVLANQTYVDDIAALRAINSTQIRANTVTWIRAHTTIGDRGEGAFWYDSTATGTDNDGTLVTPADSPTTGRWRRMEAEGGDVYLDHFGAYLAADARTAWTNALSVYPADNNSSGPKIKAGYGTYTFGGRIVTTNSINLEGSHGGDKDFYVGTEFQFPGSSVGLVIEAFTVDTDALGTTLGHISFTATAKNATETTGTIGLASNSLTLAAAQDFADGQIVRVVGAGGASRTLTGTTASTTNGSPTVNLFDLQGVAAAPAASAIHTDQLITVAGAGFPADTFVQSLGATSVTMSANATATVTQQAISYQPDLFAEIHSGGGTTTLTLDSDAEAAVTAAKVFHAECGIYVRALCRTHAPINVNGFAGPGVLINCEGTGTPAGVGGNAFCNNFGWLGGGRITQNLYGIVIKGNDANNGSFISFDVMSNDFFGVDDRSALGCHWMFLHVSGAYAYRTWSTVGNCSFIGCYVEGGGGSSFQGRTLVIGGIMPGAERGGGSILASSNAVLQGPSIFGGAAYSDYQLSSASGIGGAAAFAFALRFQYLAAGATYNLRRMVAEGLSWWAINGGNVSTNTPFLFSDTDTPSIDEGVMWFPRGWYIGDASAHNLTLGDARRWRMSTEAGGDPTGVLAGTQGDIIWNGSPTAGSRSVGWVCTTTGGAGAAVWKTFGDITA